MKWARGRETIDQLLADGKLEFITGAAADGSTWLSSASALLESALRECSSNPEAAYLLAYDAALKAATALVVQQGMRSKSAGHHLTVEQVVRAQFGGPFVAFSLLRRRRIEIEYPQRPGDDISESEAQEAIELSALIVAASAGLAPQLTLYR